MAQKLGVSESHVIKLCLGTRKPSLNLAIAIEQKTGGEVSLFDWKGPARREGRVA